MKNIRELLRDADPIRYEPTLPSGQRDFHRQTVLAAASGARAPVEVGSLSRIAVFATVALVVISTSFLGMRVWSLFVGDVHAAAIRFEVRLAEDVQTPGLREVKVSGSDRSVYLHDEVIVDNGDIAAAQVVPGSGQLQYAVDVKFNASGAEKMRTATENHIGKPVAILLDGQVVVAPVLRSAISASAMISGGLTKTQAEKIVNGIQPQK